MNSTELATMPEGLTPTQKGWLQLEANKRFIFCELQKFELSFQEKTMKILEMDKLEDLSKIQEAISLAKSVIAEMKDCRLGFTNMLQEKLIKPAMAFEKNCEEALPKYVSHELAIRIKVNEKANEAAAIAREGAAFEAHVKNEYFRIATEFKQRLSTIIINNYLECLHSKLSPEAIPEIAKALKEQISSEKPSLFVKFERKLLSEEKAKEIFLKVERYNSVPDTQSALKEVDEKFEMYSHDLQNAEAASAAIAQEHEEKVAEQNNDLQAEQAMNTIRAQAEPEPFALSGAKLNVKKTLVCDIVNSEAWAIDVILHFTKNLQILKPYLTRITSWEKVTVKQMSEAIGKYMTENPTTKFTGLTFSEKTK